MGSETPSSLRAELLAASRRGSSLAPSAAEEPNEARPTREFLGRVPWREGAAVGDHLPTATLLRAIFGRTRR